LSDKALVIAALIVGGAIVATSLQIRPRYTLSAAGNNVAWRMDTWSGQIDICAATYPPTGPIVRCGAVIVTPTAPGAPSDGNGGNSEGPVPAQPFAPPQRGPRDQASLDEPRGSPSLGKLSGRSWDASGCAIRARREAASLRGVDDREERGWRAVRELVAAPGRVDLIAAPDRVD
jgi:hypothetical protein